MNWKKAILYLLPIAILVYLFAVRPRTDTHLALVSIDRTLATQADIAANFADDARYMYRRNLDYLPNERKVLFNALDRIKNQTVYFVGEIEEIKNYLIDRTGNRSGKHDEGDYSKNYLPIGLKDRFNPSKIMLEEGKGIQIAKHAKSLRDSLISIYNFAFSLEALWPFTQLTKAQVDQKKKNYFNYVELNLNSRNLSKIEMDLRKWSRNKFDQLPLSAMLTLLTKYQADARNAQAKAAGDIAKLPGTDDRYRSTNIVPLMWARSSYIAPGRKLEAIVEIAGYKEMMMKHTQILVNGVEVKQRKNGLVNFSELTSHYGKRVLKLLAKVTNPLTGEEMRGSEQFEYEVGERAASLFLSNMNTFYIGIDNDFEVCIAGSPYSEMRIKANGAGCKLRGKEGRYRALVSNEGSVEIKAWSKDYKKTFILQAKRLPDPVVLLDGKKGGVINLERILELSSLETRMEAIPMKVDCLINSFETVLLPLRKKPIRVINDKAKFNDETRRLIKRAKSGDLLYFKKIKLECPGDSLSRMIPPLVFEIE